MELLNDNILPSVRFEWLAQYLQGLCPLVPFVLLLVLALEHESAFCHPVEAGCNTVLGLFVQLDGAFNYPGIFQII
jgi:hypothetical protein